ncbi:MAG: shikimate kinase [Gammaproteobacteria bacterium]|nr:shikimate kinase [Gammaproteobacteria bacterium]
MRKILIFGNSGSGKSTLAKKLCAAHKLSHLDLDTLAWKETSPPVRKAIRLSKSQIVEFRSRSAGWVIEGCYADLLELVINDANELYFLNLPVEVCIENAKRRPWEPHKYGSKAEQDANLEMLIDWIAHYPERDDTFSAAAHRRLYDDFDGTKHMFTSNAQAT